MIEVICTPGKAFNGPEEKFIARLLLDGILVDKTEKEDCKFEFRDLSYSTHYTLEVCVILFFYFNFIPHISSNVIIPD